MVKSVPFWHAKHATAAHAQSNPDNHRFLCFRSIGMERMCATSWEEVWREFMSLRPLAKTKWWEHGGNLLIRDKCLARCIKHKGRRDFTQWYGTGYIVKGHSSHPSHHLSAWTDLDLGLVKAAFAIRRKDSRSPTFNLSDTCSRICSVRQQLWVISKRKFGELPSRDIKEIR